MHHRKPVLSFLLSFVFSGLGQIYNGELKKGLLLAILLFPIYLLLGLAGLVDSFAGLVVMGVTILSYKFLIALDAFLQSKAANPYTLQPINTMGNYCLFLLFTSGVNWVGVTTGRTIIGYEAFNIPTISMEPSIEVGDKIMATRTSLQNLEAGDIVTFTREDGGQYLCRIIGPSPTEKPTKPLNYGPSKDYPSPH